MKPRQCPAIWFPTIRAGTGTDIFTERLALGLELHGIRTAITWIPLRSEYAPWTVRVPKPPGWATLVHVNTCMHYRFLPRHLPIVATLHHSVHAPVFRAYKGMARTIYHDHWIAPNERRVLQRANRVIAVSRYVADTARRTLLDVPMQVIHNGVDTHAFHPRERGPGSSRPFQLLYVGSWIERKGVDMLAPIMRNLGNGFELLYTGGSAAAADKRNMPENMHDIGKLNDVSAIVEAMQGADALLFPSRSEGFGLVAAEAMACGLPVIATRGSSLPELVEDGRTGLLCPPDDPSAFAEAIRTLAGSPLLHEALSRMARQRAEECFSDQLMIDAHIRLYCEMLSQGGTPDSFNQ